MPRSTWRAPPREFGHSRSSGDGAYQGSCCRRWPSVSFPAGYYDDTLGAFLLYYTKSLPGRHEHCRPSVRGGPCWHLEQRTTRAASANANVVPSRFIFKSSANSLLAGGKLSDLT